MRRGDETAEAGAEREADGLEDRRDGAVGGAHEGVAGLGVVEREVGEVGPDEAAGAAHDGVEDRARVALGRQLPCRVEQGRQPGLPVLVDLTGARDPQGEVPGRGRGRRGRDLGDRGIGGEQLEQVEDLGCWLCRLDCLGRLGSLGRSSGDCGSVRSATGRS